MIKQLTDIYANKWRQNCNVLFHNCIVVIMVNYAPVSASVIHSANNKISKYIILTACDYLLCTFRANKTNKEICI